MKENNELEETSYQKEDNKPNTSNENSKKKKKTILIVGIIIVLLVALCIGGKTLLKTDKDETSNKAGETNKKKVNSKYAIQGNSLDDFDLFFIKQNNTKINKVYSPLSIKTSLAMLSDASKGNTKDQIVAVIGDYKLKKYTNSANMSFANAMFINNTFKDGVKSAYIEKLKNKYNADVVYDSFETPNVVNKWTEDKTFGQVKDLVDDISTNSFVQVNALAIDMEWVDYFQKKGKGYSVSFKNENFSTYVSALDMDFDGVKFNNDYEAESGEFAGVINRYDIVKELGEANIRKTVGDEYQKWLDEDPCGTASEQPDAKTYLDNYIKDINSNYKHVSSSTDYLLYNDDTVKAFAKDLKTYNNVTLQYVAIMPKKDELEAFINNSDAKSISEIIRKLKSVKLENFNDRVITKITGNMPFFNFKYEIKLIEELKKLGITDIFDISKADLSNLTTAKGEAYIDKMIHKANIELTNEGIKAAAATMAGGAGAAGCYFVYNYDVPVEEINMDFDKPFMYLVRDKETGEVWFAGTVYEPNRYTYPSY